MRSIETKIQLHGAGAEDFIQRKGLPVCQSEGSDAFTLSKEWFTQAPEHWLVQQVVSHNREVVVYSDQLRRRGSKGFRRVPVNRKGFGEQQLTRDVWLVVQTNASPESFAQNIR